MAHFPYVEQEKTRQEVLNLVKEEKKKAGLEGDITKQIDLNKIEGVINSGGGIVKKTSLYTSFSQGCLLEGLKGKKPSLGEVQRRMKECAKQWNKLSPEVKEKLKKEGMFEVVNLP